MEQEILLLKKEQEETLDYLRSNWGKLTNSEKDIVNYLGGLNNE